MKKTIWLALLGLLLPSISIGQTAKANSFYNKYKSNNNSFNLTLPGWVIDLGATIAVWTTDDKEEKEAFRLMKNIQRMKLLVLEEGVNVKDKHIKKMYASLKNNDYEDLVQVRDGDTRVNILIREKKDKIRNIFLFVHEPDEAVMLSLKTKLSMDEINDMINMLNDEMDLKIN